VSNVVVVLVLTFKNKPSSVAGSVFIIGEILVEHVIIFGMGGGGVYSGGGGGGVIVTCWGQSCVARILCGKNRGS